MKNNSAVSTLAPSASTVNNLLLPLVEDLAESIGNKEEIGILNVTSPPGFGLSATVKDIAAMHDFATFELRAGIMFDDEFVASIGTPGEKNHRDLTGFLSDNPSIITISDVDKHALPIVRLAIAQIKREAAAKVIIVIQTTDADVLDPVSIFCDTGVNSYKAIEITPYANAGDLDSGIPQSDDHTKRGFQPR